MKSLCPIALIAVLAIPLGCGSASVGVEGGQDVPSTPPPIGDLVLVPPDAGTSDGTAPTDHGEPRHDTAPADGGAAGDSAPSDGVAPSDGAAPSDATAPGDGSGPADQAGGPDVPVDPGCVDFDGDGFGTGCPAGLDCDDWNPYFSVQCADCLAAPFSTGCPCNAVPQPFECFDDNLLFVGQGRCRSGSRSCIGSLWTECVGQILPLPEECNGEDDDCDGETDEGVSSACGCGPRCDVVDFGPGTANPFVPTGDNSGNLGLDDGGNLELPYFSQAQTVETFIWIANSAESTISKLDTETGQERGRYRACSDPSRTSVDVFGNVWVGCRGDGRVAKIAHSLEYCIDRNGNNQIDTSADRNGNGRIELGSDEILAEGQDECVLFTVTPDGTSSIPRAVAVDSENYAWVGLYNTGRVMRLHPDDGTTVATAQTTGSPYGLVVDKNGILWTSQRPQGQIARIDPDNLSNVQYFAPTGCVELYGITLDRFNRIWLGNSGCQDMIMFDPATSTFTHVALDALGNTRGVAASLEGYVCAAHHTWTCIGGRHVSCVDDVTLQPRGIPLGPASVYGSVGVAFDKNEHLWVVNQCTSSATKVDVATGTVFGDYPVGNGPYTYSDMTGYALHSFVVPEGYYDVIVVPGSDKMQGWLELVVDADTPEGTSISVQLRSAMSVEDLDLQPWSPRFGPFPPGAFPLSLTDPTVAPYALGEVLQVRLILYTSDPTTTPVVRGVQVFYR